VIFERIAPLQHDTIDGVPEPSENPHLVGHGQATAQLASAFRARRLPHALLFTGPSGIGKTTLAFRLAYHLLSFPRPVEAPENMLAADPASPLFRAIAQGAHPNVLYLTRPANERTKGFKTVITVDEIRRLSRFLSMTAHDGGYRIVIVDPADDLNISAANALLKSLEEPPPRTVFVLVAHSPGALLPTIRSRCQIVRLQPLREEETLEVLSALGLAVPDSPEGQAALASRAAGSVRSAILLTEYGGLEIAAAIDAVLEGTSFDIAAAAKIADAVTGREQAMQFELFTSHLLDAIAQRATAAAQLGDAAAADRLATLWSDTRRATDETDTFNLDKRQHVLGSLMRAHRARSGG
jgi:DNA polymerase III subunit delta'